MSIKLSGSKFGTYLPLFVVDTKVHANLISCQIIQGAPSAMGDMLDQANMFAGFGSELLLVHTWTAADGLGPYDLKQLNYWIQP